MISFRRIFPIVVLIAVAFGQSSHLFDDGSSDWVEIQEINLNEAFDLGLPDLRRYVWENGFDPMSVPDLRVPLSSLPSFFRKEIHLHNGNMQQMSTINRTGDIILQYNRLNKSASLYMNIGFSTLDISYAYTLKYMTFSRRGDCYARFDDVVARMLFEFNFDERKLNIKFFKFRGVGDFQLKLEGHLTDSLVNLLTGALTKIFRTEVLTVIERRTYQEIDNRVDEISDVIQSQPAFEALLDFLSGNFSVTTEEPPVSAI